MSSQQLMSSKTFILSRGEGLSKVEVSRKMCFQQSQNSCKYIPAFVLYGVIPLTSLAQLWKFQVNFQKQLYLRPEINFFKGLILNRTFQHLNVGWQRTLFSMWRF